MFEFAHLPKLKFCSSTAIATRPGNHRKFAVSLVAAATATFLNAAVLGQGPLSNAFTYQGQLSQAGTLPSGLFDMRFRMFDAASGGMQQGSAVCVNDVNLVEGRFAVPLDFGAQFAGQRRYLEIEIRQDTGLDCSNATGYALLSPRQELTGVPYAMYALNANGSGITNLNATNITSGSMQAARMPTGGNWALTSPMSLGANVFTIDPTSNRVGIGTASPGAKLHIANGDLLTGAPGEEWMIHSRSNFGSDFLQITDSDAGVPQFQRGLTIHQSGNIGIGTTGPGRPLHVSANDLFTARFANGNSTAAVVEFQNTASNAIWEYGVAGSSPPFPGQQVPFAVLQGSMYLYRQGQARPALAIDPSGTLRAMQLDAVSLNAGTLQWTNAVALSGRGNTHGVFASTPSSISTAYAVYGVTGAFSSPWAVYADGKFGASGTKSFRIDHPEDPQNKFLLHYSAESPEVINFYSGTVALDAKGEAEVQLPSYFAAVNRDPRYSLTAVGAPMPNLHVAWEIDAASLDAGARVQPGDAIPVCWFRISGGVAGAKVSWEVKAVRNDRWVQQYGAPVEQDKGEDRGSYQRPELYGESSEMLAASHPNHPNHPLNRPVTEMQNDHLPK